MIWQQKKIEVNEKDNEFKVTKKIVIAILDQIRFLFKHYNYKHEQEVRIIKFAQKENVKCTPKGDFRVPHLYIDLDKELEYKEVVLGPKVDKPIEVATYLDYTGKVGCIKKSISCNSIYSYNSLKLDICLIIFISIAYYM